MCGILGKNRSLAAIERRAVTLIELLIVIGLIALLVALLLPALSSVRRHARTALCLANLRQMQLAFVNYVGTVNDNHSFYYSPYQTAPNLWIDDLRQAGGLQGVRFCPEATDLAPMALGNLIQGGTATSAWTWRPNINSSTGILSGTYAFNGWLYTGINNPSSVDLSKTWRSEFPVFCDAMWVDTFPVSTDLPPASIYLGASYPDMAKICINRHHMAINVIFLGGNARTVNLQDLWTLKWNNAYVPPNPLPVIPPAP